MREKRTTNDKQLKIELLTQWKLEAEFRKKKVLILRLFLRNWTQQQRRGLGWEEPTRSSGTGACAGASTRWIWTLHCIPML